MLIKRITLIVFVAINTFANGHHDIEERRAHPDTGLNVRQLIEKYEYPFENHTVQTEDEYILQMHRIPHGKNSIGNNKRSPVLCMTGLLSSSADWVAMGPGNGLGYILADHGYDVWLANYRGSRWSRKHSTLEPDKDKKAYWNNSFHEIGYYDVAALIDYILNTTGEEKLFYIGLSQGTTSYFVLTSERPEYNQKIRLSVALAPAAYLGYTTDPLVHLLVKFLDKIEGFVDKHELYEILPYNPYLGPLAGIFCNDESPFQEICAIPFYLAASYTPDQLNKTMISVIASNSPAGSSFKQILHYTQLVKSKRFCQYDYGEEMNWEIYGQASPPEYELNKITAPLAFYYGSEDPLATKGNIDQTASKLPNLVVNKCIKGFNHMDVLMGIDAVRDVFDGMLELMKKY